MQLNFNSASERGSAKVRVDAGLRQYMLRVYNYMTLGVSLTGISAFMVANSSIINLFYTTQGTPTGLGYLVMLAPLGFILALSFGINRFSISAVQGLFWSFCVIMGLSLSNIFIAYTGVSIARVFFVTAIAFGGLSFYGYTTKRNLSAMHSFLVMGLIGIFIASLINLIMANGMLHFIINVVGVLVFAGLTAYDNQRIRMEYSASDSGVVIAKKSVYGALSLYLNFINMFLIMLQLFGNRE